MRTDSTVPACWNNSRRSSSVAWNDRLPTKSFAGIVNLLPRSGPSALPPAHSGAPPGNPSASWTHVVRPAACRYPNGGLTACQGNLREECSLFHEIYVLTVGDRQGGIT